ncbi:energy transducer TonB [Erythrobacter dokdonensis]|uniref:TonB protein n=1 Tax=Erythrobacter dokdonensis DSW-74 TaxID=1300349 RepID=A0A1A7BMI1_9SPHN|nr:energy transducer TonB [Erythrobacter dokdonensis]OBV12365.1 TonB protein [Erythrobacter dokdonensis DSW-74]
MMGAVAFRNEEKIGLAAALVLHGALVAVLLLQTVRSEVSVFPERMTVSLATEVGLEAASPDPVAESRAAIAPTLSEEPAPAPDTAPAEGAQPAPPKPATRTATSQPAPTRERSRPDRAPTSKPSPTPAKAAEKGGGSRIGDDFLPGAGSSTSTTETRIPASQIGPSAKASIGQALARQVKPHWTAPQGLDVDELVTLIDFDLNPDGTLKGRPRVRSQSGITDSNRAQAARHAENAIRAVQLATPFDLPAEYYEAWKSVRGARFDRNTSR